MLVREHQNQFRNAQADVQQFYGNYGVTSTFRWNNPVGTTFVYIMLIGAGGGGDGSTTGGGSGAITVWFGPAKNIPNSLQIQITTTATSILSSPGPSATTMFVANAAVTTNGGVAGTADGYVASGFYGFTAGIIGSAVAASAPTSTFLMPGSGTVAAVTGNYGYVRSSSREGFFFLTPIPVSVNGGNSSNFAQSSAYGAGAYVGNTISGGPGMAIIASW